jgi:hypothetical protein
MHYYYYYIINLKTEMVPIITGATRTSPQPYRTCMKDNTIYGQLNWFLSMLISKVLTLEKKKCCFLEINIQNQPYMHWSMYTTDAQISCMFRHSLGAIIRVIHSIKIMLSIFSDVCSTVLHTSDNLEGTTLIQWRLRDDGSQGVPKHI